MSKPKTIYFDSTGPTGNIFFILGKAQNILIDNDQLEDANNITQEVFATKSYEEALTVIRKYVELIDTKRRV